MLNELTITILSGLASILMFVSYIPQIAVLHRNKSAEDISVSFWVVLSVYLTILFILAVNAGDTGLIVAQGLNLGLALIVTAQVLYYKHKGTK